MVLLCSFTIQKFNQLIDCRYRITVSADHSNLDPVSYTHLDVYKRQVFYIATSISICNPIYFFDFIDQAALNIHFICITG